MDAWLLALRDFGRLRFEDVVQQALYYAEDGFAVSEVLREDIIEYYDGFQGWPANASTFTPSGKIPNAGDILKQPQLAGSLRRLVEAERQATQLGREAAINSVRDYFYRGPMGEQLVFFCSEQGGLLTLDDMREAEARSEPPVKFSYQGYEVYTCDTWTQGPVLLQALAILQGFDLKAMGHNTPAYLHTETEALKLAFADRDAYYGDPDFVTVPHSELLSEEYYRERRGLIDPARAWA